TPATNNYATAGTYTVKLVHDYGFNCYDSITKQVYVNAAPTAAFTVADACNTGTVTPVNSTTITPAGTGINYSWLYGDNTAAQTGNAPPHTYAMSGSYTIQLIATSDSLCADTVTQPVNIIRGTNIAFTAPPVCEGATTTFTDQTTNPYNTTIVGYTWDFADGNTDNTQNTTHSYNTAGTYNAELLLNYGNGCADSLTQQVVVNANPVAAFTVNDVCNDSVVTPVNTSTGATTYTWNFADGTGFITGNAPLHTYHNSGQYTIQLIASSSGNCADTTANNIRVIIGTNIDFSTGPVCEGATTTFTDQTTNPYSTTINSYAWDFGDGATGASQSTTHTYTTPSTYNVELKLDYGFNCLDSITKQVAVNTNPVADFNATTPCNGSAVQYTDASTSADALAAYSWQFGDGGTSVVQNPSHVFGSFGSYNSKLVVYTINGCADSITKPVNVLEVGTAQFSVAPVCIGNPSMFYSTIDSATYPVSSYQWNLVETTAGGSQASHTYSTAGTKTVTLIANFANGCADTVTGNAIVNAQPVVSAAITNVSCFGASDGAVNMTPVSGQPSFIYNWSTNPANTPDNNNVPAGIYDLTVTDGNTCTTTGSYTVTQPTQLVVDTFTNPISCFGYTDGSINLSPSGASQPYTFLWSNNQTGQNLFGIGAGTYSVTVTDVQGCTATASATLLDPALFQITNAEDVSVDLGNTITLTAQATNGNAASWLWSPDQNMTCATCQSTDVLTYNNMTYSLVVTSDLGCVDTAIVRVLVDPKRVVFVPNAFTPNGDGANDYFQVFGNKEAWKQFEVQVYNRIGEKVFESNDKDFKWDGTFKGVLQNNAVFVYVVKVV
ncbi:MAG: PKD domain-containing protein, partial [Bacteroidetes bacterium]|nr:PKD domain-containing protein [Bacteroidota bacterium]